MLLVLLAFPQIVKADPYVGKETNITLNEKVTARTY